MSGTDLKERYCKDSMVRVVFHSHASGLDAKDVLLIGVFTRSGICYDMACPAITLWLPLLDSPARRRILSTTDNLFLTVPTTVGLCSYSMFNHPLLMS